MMTAELQVGFLYPGFAAEDDFSNLARRAEPPVTARVAHTSVGEDAHRVDALLDLGSSNRLRDGAAALRTADTRSAIWACTSGSFVFGWDGAHQQVAELSAWLGVPASSTSLAFVEAAAALELHRVAVAATYPRDVAAHLVRFLGHAGIEVVQLGSRGIITAEEVGTLGRQTVRALVADNDHRDAEAIIVPDTALHTAGMIDELEAMVGKPVLTANQVSFWQALRLAGHPAHGDALGTLGRSPP